MNITKIEENVSKLMSKPLKETFVYDLLLAYGQPKTAITRLKSSAQGTYNLSKVDGEVLWKKKIFFKSVKKGDLHDIIDEAKNDPTIKKQDPRFLIVTDYKTFLAIDTKSTTSLDIEFERLSKHFDFFLPLGGLEKVSIQVENPADVKAAERMAKLYDQIKTDNPNISEKRVHELNVFLSRLLFCYFAEDTEIFEKGAFTQSIASHTNSDGSDLSEYLDRLFDVLNSKDRKKLPAFLQGFPYVNGGLLAVKIKAPKFSPKSRKILIECGELNWSEINPDIFGSMIQAVVHPDKRGGMGMHYTSVPNIMKVIKPLFLDNLHSEYEQNYSMPTKLNDLLNRMEQMKFFDPACGSGNFLVIAYKEMRKLEIKILKRLEQLSSDVLHGRDEQLSFLSKAQLSFAEAYQPTFLSRIHLHNFYGIEIDDFAHEVALLSLWLAEHQMNLLFKEQFGKVLPTLPLKEGGNIICDNALTSDWEATCKFGKGVEVFIFGNPPYLGSSLLEDSQKDDLKVSLREVKDYKKLDYISGWFYKSSELIRKFPSVVAAFVSTNSITQGEQVFPLWPKVLKDDVEISFAHHSFKWTNMAKGQAAVICVIIGMQTKSKKRKILFTNDIQRQCEHINAYLVPTDNIYVEKRTKPISDLPKVAYGNKPVDGGNLILSLEEKTELIAQYPEANKFIRELSGAHDFLNGYSRWCLWIEDEQLSLALNIPPIKKRVDLVKKMRLDSVDSGANELAKRSHQFRDMKTSNSAIILPIHTSERREYIPFGFVGQDTIIHNSALAIFNAEPWVFGIISSRMHMVWVRTVAGRLKSDYRYSAEICYNTFPLPELSPKSKETLSNHTMNILREREAHSDKTLAELYDPEYMPKALLSAHKNLDDFVDSLYKSKPLNSDEERAVLLLIKYNELKNKKKDAVANA